VHRLTYPPRRLQALRVFSGQFCRQFSGYFYTSLHMSQEPSSTFSDPASFIRLTPANSDARQAFNDLSILIKSQDMLPDLRHVSQFMVIDPWRPRSSSQEAALVSNTDTGTDSDARQIDNLPEVEPLQYQGYYDLSWDKPPKIPQVGWLVGIGRWDRQKLAFSQNGAVGLMLAPFAVPPFKHDVAGKHATLSFDKTGNFWVRVVSPRKPVVALGSEEFSSGSRMITSPTQLIAFGRLVYHLAFATQDESTYQRNMKLFFTTQLNRPPPPPEICATPSPWDFVIEDWVCKGTVGTGAFGTVFAAKNRFTGETGAAKIVLRNEKMWPMVSREIDIFDLIPDHVLIIQLRLVYLLTG
jgi:hypothetical protein